MLLRDVQIAFCLNKNPHPLHALNHTSAHLTHLQPHSHRKKTNQHVFDDENLNLKPRNRVLRFRPAFQGVFV